ncbi:MAG: hypothetical protein ACD_71C00032G0001, partial [uncultured bacterium (gcode 4)]
MEKILWWDTAILDNGNEPLGGTIGLIKNQINVIIQSITTFSQKIVAIGDYADFERMKNEINNFLISIFKDDLHWKSAGFILWFEQWNISKYQTEHDLDKVDLMRLLAFKNRFYTETLRQIVSLWKLDAILKLEEREDLLNMIESWVFSFL